MKIIAFRINHLQPRCNLNIHLKHNYYEKCKNRKVGRFTSDEFYTSCEKNDVDAINPIIGVWMLDAFTVSFTIDGVSYVDYLVAEYGFTLQEAEAYAELGNTEFIGNYIFEFKEDGTAVITLDGDEGVGTWTLIGEVLRLTNETDPEAVFVVATLTASTLVIEMSESEMEDINGDGTDELFETTATYTFTK